MKTFKVSSAKAAEYPVKIEFLPGNQLVKFQCRRYLQDKAEQL